MKIGNFFFSDVGPVSGQYHIYGIIFRKSNALYTIYDIFLG